MGRALYRKYRSKSLSEIIGQEHITKTLANSLNKGTFGHAYLFTGPRGVGKTSIARILAHEVNGLDYDEKSNHLDIIEIDAASNRRIDEIRELRERVRTAPASAKYKVYIIDEVHMLTKEAFNALLKTLEEPPEHVIFILATTEAHKLPETIISRTQRFSFKPIPAKVAVDHLKTIASKEQIDIDEAALELISEHGDGSFRDSISLLDQASGIDSHISVEAVQSMLGIPPKQAIEELLRKLETGDKQGILKLLGDLRGQGFLASNIAKRLGAELRDNLVSGKLAAVDDPGKLLKELLEVPSAHDPNVILEIALLTSTPITGVDLPVKSESNITPKIATDTSKPKKPVKSDPPVEDKPLTDDNKHAETDSGNPGLNTELWNQTLNDIKQKHNTLYSIARMAVPSFRDESIVLEFSFPFHFKRMDDAKNKTLISQIASKHAGKPVTIECKLNARADDTVEPKASAAAGHITSVNSVFGNAEILE